MMELVSMDVLYFSVYGDFTPKVNMGQNVGQTQYFTCLDYGRLSFN